MTVRKFRSVEEMPSARCLAPLEAENIRIACELTELAYALHPWSFEPGIRKFASMEEANAHREQWRNRQIRQRARE